MFTSHSAPSLLFFAGLFAVSESPCWLICKNRMSEAGKVLAKIGGAVYVESEMESIRQSFAREVKETVRDLFKKDVRAIVLPGALIAVFSQADGQNSLFSYARDIFGGAGLSKDTAFLQAVILGFINFIFTFVAIGAIDRLGRKKLLLYGSALLCLDAVAIAAAFYFHLSGVGVLCFVLCFIAIYASTLGPVTWVALSEIFPNHIRGNAMALSTPALWLANFFTTASFPVMKQHLPHLFFLCASSHAGNKRQNPGRN